MAKQIGKPPFEWTDEIRERICEIISTSKYGLHRICKNNPDLPKFSTIMKELANNPQFANHYAHAREAQADYILDESFDILDDNSNDTIVTEKGEIPNNEWINRSKARADFRKWMASRLAPKKYGDKQAIEHSGKIETPAPPTIVFEISQDVADKAIKQAEADRAKKKTK
jgi:hypothetical protein